MNLEDQDQHLGVLLEKMRANGLIRSLIYCPASHFQPEPYFSIILSNFVYLRIELVSLTEVNLLTRQTNALRRYKTLTHVPWDPRETNQLFDKVDPLISHINKLIDLKVSIKRKNSISMTAEEASELGELLKISATSHQRESKDRPAE